MGDTIVSHKYATADSLNDLLSNGQLDDYSNFIQMACYCLILEFVLWIVDKVICVTNDSPVFQENLSSGVELLFLSYDNVRQVLYWRLRVCKCHAISISFEKLPRILCIYFETALSLTNYLGFSVFIVRPPCLSLFCLYSMSEFVETGKNVMKENCLSYSYKIVFIL